MVHHRDLHVLHHSFPTRRASVVTSAQCVCSLLNRSRLALIFSTVGLILTNGLGVVMKLGKGFTLIELVVAMAIVAILATIALASYQYAIVKSRRGSAKAFLMDAITREQQYLLDARAYAATKSEEHTSELQSLMRNSYAVFCLKKKNKNIQ